MRRMPIVAAVAAVALLIVAGCQGARDGDGELVAVPARVKTAAAPAPGRAVKKDPVDLTAYGALAAAAARAARREHHPERKITIEWGWRHALDGVTVELTIDGVNHTTYPGDVTHNHPPETVTASSVSIGVASTSLASGNSFVTCSITDPARPKPVYKKKPGPGRAAAVCSV